MSKENANHNGLDTRAQDAPADVLWDRVAHRYGIDQRDIDWLRLRTGFEQMSMLNTALLTPNFELQRRLKVAEGRAPTEPPAQLRATIRDLLIRMLSENRHVESTLHDIMAAIALSDRLCRCGDHTLNEDGICDVCRMTPDVEQSAALAPLADPPPDQG